MAENSFANRTELAAWIANEGYKEHFAVANGFLSYSEGLMGNRVAADKDSRYAHAIALLGGKAYKSYLSSVLLASQGLVEDMGIIARSLVNLCIVARWITNTNREARARRYIGWIWVEMFEMTRSNPAPPGVQVGIDERYKSFRGLFQSRNKKGKLVSWKTWHNSSIKEMASEVGMLEYYQGYYAPLSATEHSSALAYFGMAGQKTPSGDIVIGLGDHRFLAEYLKCVFVCFADVLVLWNDVFKVVKEPELRGKISEGIDFFKTINNRRPVTPNTRQP
ncbi:MAG TPA: DUF5677 domain-containing protein [Candidatus Sulfotelmatobacter sp.]|jgi:hypothetical protein|nr:DUF5677 domain-containing protein [Candidatus Sulfotelmatobacter sp.]